MYSHIFCTNFVLKPYFSYFLVVIIVLRHGYVSNLLGCCSTNDPAIERYRRYSIIFSYLVGLFCIFIILGSDSAPNVCTLIGDIFDVFFALLFFYFPVAYRPFVTWTYDSVGLDT